MGSSCAGTGRANNGRVAQTANWPCSPHRSIWSRCSRSRNWRRRRLKLAARAAFSRRCRMNGERMDAALEFVRQRRVDHAVAFQPGLSPERPRYNIESEMRLAARPMAGMALMQMGFVFDVQAFRRKSCNKFGRDDVLDSHCQARSGQARLCANTLGDNKTLGVPAGRAVLPAVK